MTRIYLTLQEVLEFHRLLIEEFGGTDGVRDMGALESALMRPQLGYYKNMIEESAALMESLANNHPFVDGNKRVAFFITDTFLRLNGKLIDCDSLAAYQFFTTLFETHTFDFEHLKIWLEKHIIPLS